MNAHARQGPVAASLGRQSCNYPVLGFQSQSGIRHAQCVFGATSTATYGSRWAQALPHMILRWHKRKERQQRAYCTIKIIVPFVIKVVLIIVTAIMQLHYPVRSHKVGFLRAPALVALQRHNACIWSRHRHAAVSCAQGLQLG